VKRVTSRRAARRTAIEILYESDLRRQDPTDAIAAREAATGEVPGFAAELVRGVTANREELDLRIGRHAEGWTVDRMAAVDRSILRVAAFELLVARDVPVAAAIDEAVRAAKELSTEDSARFVNGVLGGIARGRGAPEPLAGDVGDGRELPG
jgi:transcription antitermination protein NusB